MVDDVDGAQMANSGRTYRRNTADSHAKTLQQKESGVFFGGEIPMCLYLSVLTNKKQIVMANAFKMLGDLISGLTALLMSLIGLGITAQVLGIGWSGFDVIGSITGLVSDFASADLAGLIALLVILSFMGKK